MQFDKITLCTDAPRGQGLAYYYYRAFCDVIGASKVSIVDEGDRNYGASIIARSVRRLKHDLGLLSRKKIQRVGKELVSGTNVVILFNNSDLRHEEIKALAENPNVFLVNYLSDHPHGMIIQRQRAVVQSLPYFKLICTFAQDLLPVLYQLGGQRVERIPFAYCKYTHQLPSQNVGVEFPGKVFYFGTWSPEIERWLGHLTQFDLQIEGNSWSKATNSVLREIGIRKKPNTDHNMAIMARKAGVVVNFTRATHGCFHTMKTFELMAAGACVVSNFSREQDEFFADGKSMMYFNTPAELNSKVDELLQHAEKAASMRANALIGSKGQSYHERAAQLINILTKI